MERYFESTCHFYGFIAGHRRLTRRPYAWEMNLDPRLVRGSCSSLTSDGQGISDSHTDSPSPSLHGITLEVIEAAVQRTVQTLLSVGSLNSSRNVSLEIPDFNFGQG